MVSDRLADLIRRRDASLTRMGGSPMPGYKERVEALNREIARLEGESGVS